MFETLDTMISLGVIFLILSMVHKYLMSMVKRFFKIKAKVVAEEMKTFIGENTSKYMIPFLEKNAKYLNVLDIVNGTNALRQLNNVQLKGIVVDLKKFLGNKDNFKEIEKLVPEINSENIEAEINKIKTHLEVLENKIESAYDNTMAKISEVYETKLRYRTFYCGMILAFIINADFFGIYNSLSKNSLAREELVARTDVITAQIDIVSKQMEPSDIKGVIDEANNSITSLIGNIESAGIELGWTKEKISKTCEDVGSIVYKLIGMLMAGLLISFGAPFWHDFIGTFAGIRKTLLEEKKGNGGVTTLTTAEKTEENKSE